MTPPSFVYAGWLRTAVPGFQEQNINTLPQWDQRHQYILILEDNLFFPTPHVAFERRFDKYLSFSEKTTA
jgi:hypothetical protein